MESLLLFYAHYDVIFTTWGKLPENVLNQLPFSRTRSSLIGRIFSHEINWHLNDETVNSLIGAFCDHHVIEKFTWGLRKGNIPLGLCRAWDDMNVNGSDLIEESVLLGWVEELKSKEIIESFEIISD